MPFSLPAYAPVVTIWMAFCQIFHEVCKFYALFHEVYKFYALFHEVYKFYALFLHSFGVLSSKYFLQCFVFMQCVGDFYCVLMTVKANQQLN